MASPAKPKSPAGLMRVVLAFDKRSVVDDGYGNTESEFAEQFSCPAETKALHGTETVMASRLTGVQPYLVTIRYCVAAAAITTGWRARDVRTGAVYDITTTVTRPRRDYIDMTCTIGKAA